MLPDKPNESILREIGCRLLYKCHSFFVCDINYEWESLTCNGLGLLRRIIIIKF